MSTLTLNTGATIPIIGFGTWEINPDDNAEAAVAAALQAGYRLIDTARIYDNEQGVGRAIEKSGIQREELFVTTKLWNDDQGYDRTLQAFEASMARLGLAYLDLYLIHWPASTRRHESWRAFERLQQEGRIRAAGVSNYTIEHLKALIDRSPLLPAVNQIEFHPFIYQQQRPVLEFCQKMGILVEAYSPLSRISSMQNTPVHHIAERLEKTPQQVILRWCVQHGTVPLPRSTSAKHSAENLAIDTFELSESDMAIINGLSDGERVTWDPAGMGA